MEYIRRLQRAIRWILDIFQPLSGPFSIFVRLGIFACTICPFLRVFEYVAIRYCVRRDIFEDHLLFLHSLFNFVWATCILICFLLDYLSENLASLKSRWSSWAASFACWLLSCQRVRNSSIQGYVNAESQTDTPSSTKVDAEAQTDTPSSAKVDAESQTDTPSTRDIDVQTNTPAAAQVNAESQTDMPPAEAFNTESTERALPIPSADIRTWQLRYFVAVIRLGKLQKDMRFLFHHNTRLLASRMRAKILWNAQGEYECEEGTRHEVQLHCNRDIYWEDIEHQLVDANYIWDKEIIIQSILKRKAKDPKDSWWYKFPTLASHLLLQDMLDDNEVELEALRLSVARCETKCVELLAELSRVEFENRFCTCSRDQFASDSLNEEEHSSSAVALLQDSEDSTTTPSPEADPPSSTTPSLEADSSSSTIPSPEADPSSSTIPSPEADPSSSTTPSPEAAPSSSITPSPEVSLPSPATSLLKVESPSPVLLPPEAHPPSPTVNSSEDVVSETSDPTQDEENKENVVSVKNEPPSELGEMIGAILLADNTSRATLAAASSEAVPSSASDPEGDSTPDASHAHPAPPTPPPSPEAQTTPPPDIVEPAVAYTKSGPGVTLWFRITDAKTSKQAKDAPLSYFDISGNLLTSGTSDGAPATDKDRAPTTVPFHYILGPDEGTDSLVQALGSTVRRLVAADGFEGCLIADGFSGCGKSTTIKELVPAIANRVLGSENFAAGSTLRFAVASEHEKNRLKFFHDQSSPSGRNQSHNLEQAEQVIGLTNPKAVQYIIPDEKELRFLLHCLFISRFLAIRRTDNNDTSSRGWIAYIFTVVSPSGQSATLYLIDQPGNERTATDASKDQQSETIFINESRMHLFKALKAYQHNKKLVLRDTAMAKLIEPVFDARNNNKIILLYHGSKHQSYPSMIKPLLDKSRELFPASAADLRRLEGKSADSMKTTPPLHSTDPSAVNRRPSGDSSAI